MKSEILEIQVSFYVLKFVLSRYEQIVYQGLIRNYSITDESNGLFWFRKP